MKRIIEELQKLSDRAQRPKGSEERRYFALDAESAMAKISELIVHSRSSVVAALDDWGVRLISQCKPSLIRAITNGIEPRLLVASECIGGEHLHSLPDGIELRTGVFASNLIAIDSIKMMTIESSNGKAALFASTDPFGASQLRHFEQAWSDAREVHFLLDTQPAIAAAAVQMARVVENGLSARMLGSAFAGHDIASELIDVVESKYGLKVLSMQTTEMLLSVDSALRLCCHGGLKHDKANNTLSLHSSFEGKNVIPWALLVASYFRRRGNEAKIVQHGENGQVVHLKLTKPAI
jgi:hypothetical protein